VSSHVLVFEKAVTKAIVFVILIIFQGLKHMFQTSLHSITKIFNTIVAIVLGVCDFPGIRIENWYLATRKATKLLAIRLILFLVHLFTFFRRIGISSPSVCSINVISLQLPRLHERREDIPCLVEHFLFKITQSETHFPRSPEDGILIRTCASH